jgi:hypothetical protein
VCGVLNSAVSSVAEARMLPPMRSLQRRQLQVAALGFRASDGEPWMAAASDPQEGLPTSGRGPLLALAREVERASRGPRAAFDAEFDWHAVPLGDTQCVSFALDRVLFE